MDETKPWYTSKGVWGGVVAMILGILATAGLDIGSEQDTIVDLLVQIGVVVAGLLALVGRLKAKNRILVWLVFAMMFLTSCTSMPAEYGLLIEKSAIVVGELNERCQAGDDAACKEGLKGASKTLDLIVEGLHGGGGRGGDDL